MSTRRYYAPIANYTGASHQRPASEHLRYSLWAYTPDFGEDVELGGPIDAPLFIASGGVAAIDFPGDGTLQPITLGCAHVYRGGLNS